MTTSQTLHNSLMTLSVCVRYLCVSDFGSRCLNKRQKICNNLFRNQSSGTVCIVFVRQNTQGKFIFTANQNLIHFKGYLQRASAATATLMLRSVIYIQSDTCKASLVIIGVKRSSVYFLHYNLMGTEWGTE